MNTVTIVDGTYIFGDLMPDVYTVNVIVPFGFVATTPSSVLVAVEAGMDYQVDFGITELSTISGTVFEDLNGDGVFDFGERAAVVLSNRDTDGYVIADAVQWIARER